MPFDAGTSLLRTVFVVSLTYTYSSPPVFDLDPVRPESSLLKPKVLIAILARNAEHSLPFHLGCIDRLEYPKDRIAIWYEVLQSNRLMFCFFNVVVVFCF